MRIMDPRIITQLLKVLGSVSESCMQSFARENLIQYSWLLSELRAAVGELAREITTPSIIYGDSKDSIPLAFNGETAHLARSNVLHLMATAAEIGSCFSIQRVFRDEHVKTRFHLSEFDLLDAVFVRTGIEDVMEFVEALIRRVHERATREFGNGAISPLDGKRFKRFNWHQARSMACVLESEDLSHVQMLDEPYFLENLPKGQVSWALRDSPNGNKCSFNLILPIAGETAEGGERDLDGKSMMLKFENIGRIKQLGWYAKALTRLQGPVTTFGVGVERLAMWLFKRDDIADVNLFYRKLTFSEL